MQFRSPQNTYFYNDHALFLWFKEKIKNNAIEAIEGFIQINNDVLSQINLLEVFPTETNLSNRYGGITLNLNLLQLAALHGNEHIFERVAKLFRKVTGKTNNALIMEKGDNNTCNGFNLLHIAAMNPNPGPLNSILSICPEAANVASVNGKLPLEIAYEADNTGLIRTLFDVTSGANLDKIQKKSEQKGLQEIIVRMSKEKEDYFAAHQRASELNVRLKKEKEDYFAARQRVAELIARLDKISEDDTPDLYESNGQWEFLPSDYKERCQKYRPGLIALYKNKDLTLKDLGSLFVMTVKMFVEETEAELTDEGQAKLTRTNIKRILDRLSEFLSLGATTDIDTLVRTLKEYGCKDGLSFLTKEILSETSTRDQAIPVLHELIRFYNHTIPLLNTIMSRVRIPVYEGESSNEVFKKAFDIYYQFETLYGLLMKIEPWRSYPASLFEDLMKSMDSVSHLQDRLKEWIDLLQKAVALNAKYQRIHCDYKCVRFSTTSPQFFKVQNLIAISQIISTAEDELPRLERMHTLYPDLIDRLNTFITRRSLLSDGLEQAKSLAYQAYQFKDPEDIKFFLGEIQRFFKEKFPDEKAQENLANYFAVLEAAASFRLTQNTVERVVVGSGLEIRIVNNEVNLVGKKLTSLDTKELNKLTKTIQNLTEQEKKKTQQAQQDLQDQIQKLKNLVESIKKLSGDPAHYAPIVDAIEKIDDETVYQYYARIDTLTAINQIKINIVAAEAAIEKVKREIGAVKLNINANLEKQEIILQKLRHLNQFENALIKPSHKAVIDRLENSLVETRDNLKKVVSLKELKAMQVKCEDALSTTSDFHNNVFSTYSHDKLTEFKILIQEIGRLIADYVDDARQLCVPQYKILEDFQTEVHALPGLYPFVRSYKKAVTELDKRLGDSISAARKQKESYQKTIDTVTKLNKQLADAIAKLNAELTKFKELQQGLKFPAASMHIFSEIDREIDDLIATTKISYVAEEEERENSKDDQLEALSEQATKKIPQIEAAAITAKSLDDITTLPERYQQLTKQLSELSTKIITKTQEARRAEDKAKEQSDKQENKTLSEAKKALGEKIKKLIDLQQRIAITGVDSTLEAFKDNLAIISAITGDQNDICTIKSAVELLAPLTIIDQVTGLDTKVDMAIQEAEIALKTAIRIQLTGMVDSYNDKMTKLYETLKEPLTAPSTDCQNSAKKFTALIKQPDFQKQCATPPIEQVVTELSSQPSQKAFASSWRNFQQTHTDASKAIEDETILAQSEYQNYQNTIQSLKGLIERFNQNHLLYNEILTACSQNLAGLQRISEKYAGERNKFITLLCESVNHPATLSLAKLDALVKEKGLMSLEGMEKEATRHLKNLITYKNQANDYQTTTTSTKKEEYLKLQTTLGTLKTNLEDWSAKNYLPLDSSKIQELLQESEQLLSAEQDPNQSYLSFLTEEIAKLKNLEGRIKEFTADAKQVEITYQQRTSKIYTALPALKTAITNFHNLALYATNTETVGVNDANTLIAKMYYYFSHEISKPVVNPDNGILSQVEKDVKDLQDLLTALNKKLGENKDKKELDEKDRLNKADKDLQEKLANLEDLTKRLVFLHNKLDVSRLPHALIQQIHSLQDVSKIARNREALSAASQKINEFIEQQLKPAIEQVFQQLIVELSNDYKIAVDQFDVVKVKPNADAVVEACKNLDVEFTKKVTALGFCVDAFQTRDALSALSPALFVSGKAAEIDSAKFKKAISSLQSLVKNHKAAILGKISTFNDAQNQDTNSAKEDYEKALAKLENLQARYRKIQTLSPNANNDWEQRTNKVIEDAKTKPKNNAEDYRTAITSVEDEIKLLKSEVIPSLATIMSDILKPYNDAIENFGADKLNLSQVPPAVKNLYQLLLILKVPSHLAKITVNADDIVDAKDKQFDSFITNISKYVGDAASAVNGEKDRLTQVASQQDQDREAKEKEQLDKAEKAFQKKKQKLEEEKQKKALDDAKKKKQEEEKAQKKLEEEKRKQAEAEEKRRLQQQKEEAEKQRLLEQALKESKERAEAEKKKKEEEEARKKGEDKKDEEPTAPQNNEAGAKTSKSGAKTGTAVTPSKQPVPTGNIVDDIFSTLTQTPSITAAPKVSKQDQTVPPKQKHEKKKKKKKQVTTQDGSSPVVQQPIVTANTIQVTAAQPKQQRSPIHYESPYLQAVRTYMNDLERRIVAQSEFNPDISLIFKRIIPQFKKFTEELNGDEIALADDNDIEHHIEEVHKVFERWINDSKIAQQSEPFSLGRFFKVLFGWGNKRMVNGQEIEIKHSNTASFLADLENYQQIQANELKSKKRSQSPAGRLIVVQENDLSYSRMSQTFENSEPGEIDTTASPADNEEIAKQSRTEKTQAPQSSWAYIPTEKDKKIWQGRLYGGTTRPKEPKAPPQVDVIGVLTTTTDRMAKEEHQKQTATATHKKPNGSKSG